MYVKLFMQAVHSNVSRIGQLFWKQTLFQLPTSSHLQYLQRSAWAPTIWHTYANKSSEQISWCENSRQTRDTHYPPHLCVEFSQVSWERGFRGQVRNDQRKPGKPKCHKSLTVRSLTSHSPFGHWPQPPQVQGNVQRALLSLSNQGSVAVWSMHRSARFLRSRVRLQVAAGQDSLTNKQKLFKVFLTSTSLTM